jgi:hypothetical protein
MANKEIKSSIKIHAPKERVWDVLLKDEYTRQWYAEFGEGTKAETDWKVGSHAFFTDDSECGLISRVVVNKPNEELLLRYEGIMVNGVADYTSPEAKQTEGGYESYKLSEKDGITLLESSAMMSEEMYDMMKGAWERASNKIKELAENP